MKTFLSGQIREKNKTKQYNAPQCNVESKNNNNMAKEG